MDLCDFFIFWAAPLIMLFLGLRRNGVALLDMAIPPDGAMAFIPVARINATIQVVQIQKKIE